MNRRHTHDDDPELGGGLVAAFALTIVMTLTAFVLAKEYGFGKGILSKIMH